MFVHKDIIIVFLFIFFVNLVILVLIISDLKKINKFLNNFSGSSLKSGKLFFYKLFEPIAFNINKIIGNYEYKFRNEKVRVFFFEYFYKHFPDPLLIINQSLSIIETNLAARELIGESAQGKNIFSVLRIPELGELIYESLKKKRFTMFGFQEVKTLEQINLTLLDYLIQHLLTTSKTYKEISSLMPVMN